MTEAEKRKQSEERIRKSISDMLDKELAEHPWTDEDTDSSSAAHMSRDKPTDNAVGAHKEIDTEVLALLRKQEERHQQSVNGRRTFAKWTAWAAFAVLLFILIANGSTPDTTGEWLPDTGTYIWISIALFVIAAIVAGTAQE